MNLTARQRFLKTMAYEPVDRPPYFEEGVRDEVRQAWLDSDQARPADLERIASPETQLEFQPAVWPLKEKVNWPTDLAEMPGFRKLLDPTNSREMKKRLGDDFEDLLALASRPETVPMLRVDKGFFQAMGVRDWSRFADIMRLFVKGREVVTAMLAAQSELTAALTGMICQRLTPTAAIFNEALGGNNGPLISPQAYAELVLPHYRPAMEVLKAAGVKWFIFRTYANSRIMLPHVLDFGFNCLWACEVSHESMDYRDIRADLGKELRLIGGIDLDVLLTDKAAIKREISEKVPELLADGGYVPLADGRVRETVPFENYRYYRDMLSEVVG